VSDDVTITVRVNNQTAAGIRDVNGQLRTLDGRFAASAGSMNRSGSAMSKALVDVKASLLSLAPAAVPVAAALAPIAVHAGAAGLAVGAFGAAVIPQIANLKDAATAQTKYTDAVTKYGARSQQAVQAQQLVADTLAGMPKATQSASAAFSNLQGTFKDFSDSTAKFTMVPVEHSFAVLGAIIPKLTPMVASSSTQLDRLMKVAGGAVNSSGFDTLSKKVADFSNKALREATDGAIHFIRVMSQGDASGPITQFMAYAKEQGPAVKELLSNLVAAIGNIAQGAADAGPGLLTVVNALAKVAAAVPPEVIGNLMQMYAAFKLIKLAGAGIGAAAGGITTLRASIAALTAASATAGGGLAGLKAAFMSLSISARAALITTGVGAIVVALGMLSSMGEKAPPDVNKVTTSLKGLAETGKNAGESARAWGTDFDGLSKSLSRLNPKGFDGFLQGWAKFLGTDSTMVKTSKEDIDSLDKSLADLVKGGKADIAAKALERVGKKLSPKDFKELKRNIDDYKSALADQALEAKFTAESQGLFGKAAQDTAAKLDAQKASADGLRQSIQALNDVNRQGLGGMIGFEAAIDAAAKAAQANAGALSMSGGVLNLNSEKARNAASALQDLADKTDSAAAANRESTGSWEGAIGIYQRGRAALIKNAQAMGLSKTEAAALADQILKIPDKHARVKMDTEDARAGLNAFNAAVKRTPGSKSVTLKTLSKGAEQILESFGLKVKRLPNGKVKVTAAAGGALSAIGNVAGALNNLNGKTARTYVVTSYTQIRNKGYSGNSATGGHAAGGKVRGYAGGGDVQAYPDGGFIQGPGSGTSDSIVTLLGSGNVVRSSNTEFIVNARETARHRRLLELINSGQLPKFARGGSVGRAARGARDEIRDATSGSTERRLLSLVDAISRGHIKMATALKQVSTALDKAKDKLSSLKSSASQLSSSVKSNILSASNITQGAGPDKTVTVGTIMGGLTASRDKATAFASALKRLRTRGLSKGLLQQIAEAGVEGGGLETAGALLTASGSELKSVNSLGGQISKAAGSAGATTAAAVYGAQLKSQERLVKALDSLEKALKRATSKHKAGRKAAGGIVGAAASGGLRGGLTWVGEQEPELLDLPVGSRVWSGPDSRRKAASTAGGGGPAAPIVINLWFGTREFGQLWIDTGRHEVRTRGGIQAALG